MNYEISHNCQVKNLNDILIAHFGYRTNGTFVEVGAYDGYNFSNTWGLAKIGWKGLYVEPIPEYAHRCRQTHKDHDVQVLSLAVGDHNGSVEMLIAETVSTYDPLYIKSQTWSNHYNPRNKVSVALVTLNDILTTYIKVPEFDLLVVDTEGSELKVLNGFDISYWKPKMVIVEAHEHSPFEELRILAPEINDYMFYSNYEKIYSDEINNIYIR